MRTSITFFIYLIFCSKLFSQILFEDKSSQLGLNANCGITYLGNGITFTDFDNDGWDDISLTTGDGVPIRIFKNNNGQFTEQFFNIPSTNYQTRQINWVDFDNDGDKDLYVTSDTNGNKLFENDGSFNFTDITIASGLPSNNIFTFGASWGDYNNDGFLDVYISNRDETTFTIPNFLYRNNGNGTFTDVSLSAGLNTQAHSSFCSAFFDFNNDGWQDIFVANDRYIYENFLYKNNGDGTFTDVSLPSGTGLYMDGMSATIGDFNSDGWFDIYVTNTPDGNALLQNNGDETFTNIADASGTAFNSVGWGSVFLDIENDKDLDIYVSGSPLGNNTYLSSALYENLGPTFNIPANTGISSESAKSHSNAIGDFNNDGKPDIAVANDNNQNMYLWENLTTTTNNWLKVKLEGTTSNKDGIGSIIEISVNGNKQYRYTLSGEGYLSQNSGYEIFGLGSSTLVDYVKVTWLSGIVDVFNNVNANQTLEIIENSETLSVLGENNNQEISIYPNPVSNILTVNTLSKPDTIQLFNNIGQKLYIVTNTSLATKLNMSNLDSGIYYLKILRESKVEILRVIKN